MFMAAAHTLADQVTALDLRQGSLYPPLRMFAGIGAYCDGRSRDRLSRWVGAWGRTPPICWDS
jgi:hypothetical protein